MEYSENNKSSQSHNTYNHSHHYRSSNRFQRFLHRSDEQLDDGEAFKRSAMSARRRRKLIANIVFTLMCIVAVHHRLLALGNDERRITSLLQRLKKKGKKDRDNRDIF